MKNNSILKTALLSIVLLVFLISPISAVNVQGSEHGTHIVYTHFGNEEVREYGKVAEYTIVDDKTVYDSSNETFYTFDTTEDLMLFISIMRGESTRTRSSCLPGAPGYPQCQSNPVVKVENVAVSSYNTGWLRHTTLLLGAGGWVNGGQYGATMAFTSSTTLGYSYDGVSFSRSVGKSSSFAVPAGRRGNIQYESRWKIETFQQWHILKDGTRTKGPTVKSAKFIEGSFVGVYKN